MKHWRIRFTREVSFKISKFHPDIKALIKKSLNELRYDPYIGKDLQQELSGFKTLRLKRYRIIYDLDEENHYIHVYYVGKRKDVYEQFRQLLTDLRGA